MSPSNPYDTTDEPLLDRLEHALMAGRISRRGFIRAAAAAGLAGSSLQVLADELDAVGAPERQPGSQLGAAACYHRQPPPASH